MAEATKKQQAAELSAPEAEMHGSRGVGRSWDPPRMRAECHDDARPGYATKKAHEYVDTTATLKEKVRELAGMLRAAKNCIVYSGAGISTASGIGDYATKAQSSLDARPKLLSPAAALPTKAHRVIVNLYEQGLVKRWVNQNHDGLPQKAGLPQEAINEIHGAWFDPSNPVVKMSGDLRDDLFDDLLAWEKKTDLCLALGTSLCGMNADRLASTPAKKAAQGKAGALGLVIVSLQQTQYDEDSNLRIFATLDQVMTMLHEELGFEALSEEPPLYKATPGKTKVSQDVFSVPYDARGNLAEGQTLRLDLRKGSKVRITDGPRAGSVAEITGKDKQGHYKLTAQVKLKPTATTTHPVTMRMGSWWVTAAAQGKVTRLPVVPVGAGVRA